MFSSFFKGHLSSFEALIEELIKLKQLRKEGFLFILRELAQFYFRGDCYLSQHALRMSGYGE